MTIRRLEFDPPLFPTTQDLHNFKMELIRPFSHQLPDDYMDFITPRGYAFEYGLRAHRLPSGIVQGELVVMSGRKKLDTTHFELSKFRRYAAERKGVTYTIPPDADLNRNPFALWLERLFHPRSITLPIDAEHPNVFIGKVRKNMPNRVQIDALLVFDDPAFRSAKSQIIEKRKVIAEEIRGA